MSHRYRPQSVLFVCTGNIFRSLAAEQALKATLGSRASFLVGSAGIDAKPQVVHEWVQTRLRLKGADPSAHVQRQLTREMILATDLVIAMGCNHQAFIRERFGRDVPLFNQVCFGRDEPIEDVHEVMPAWEQNLEQARAYVWSVIDRIWEATPALIQRLPSFRSSK
ncbi:MAG TPA: low molecular weight phosphatase family protein [Nitrospira sp.]